eukprot:g20734.t1
MRPQIRLIDGLHLTATDKRNLLAVIEFERASPPEVWGTRWLGLPKSQKSYAVLPDPEKPGRYSAVIKTRERNDWGEPRDRKSTDEATAWRYASRTGHEVWEVIEYGPNAGERFLGQG